MTRSPERRLQALSLGGGAPAVLLSLILLFLSHWPWPLKALLAALILIVWMESARRLRNRALRPMQTLANLLAALREGDYSFRAKGDLQEGGLGDVYRELNTLSELLQQQRIGALEATALLRTVMGEIDVAIFAFDAGNRLRLVNRAGESLLARPAARATGASAEELGLAEALSGGSPRLVDLALPGRAGRWELRRGPFRQGGHPHTLLVLSDLTRPLREEERQAWQRLVRVLSHEINNTLAPIHSLADSLQNLIRKTPRPPDMEEDLGKGLDIIAGRSEALQRFLQAYAQLAKLPPPVLRPVDLGALATRASSLENRVPVRLEGGPSLSLEADGDQLEQLLINLLKNAAEACGTSGGAVTLGWRAERGQLELVVEDEGPGLPPSSNLFVPFFTTKPGGSGIGLLLCRQIAEAHGGSLRLENRTDRTGARATLQLPLAAPE
jgi:nitrogen fixation/metabolism regulation signal transduction histidine kinase